MTSPALRAPLRATYRLQVSSQFTLEQARAIVPYLERLGVSHLYLSPVLAARPGSTHGYDVADPTNVNPELGGEAALRALADDVHARGMGILLDIVPNHMGTGPANPFWEDVLTHGRRSRWAHWFDIDWAAPRRRGRVFLPVLGSPLIEVVERGEISLARDGDAWRVKYFDNSFPVDPRTLDGLDDEQARRLTEGEEGKGRLRALLDHQNYELAYWQRASREINYRRFFDVNELVALRVEDPRVFDETHALVLRLVEEGVVDGLRIDHVDGLLDPAAYLARLRAECDARVASDRPGERAPRVDGGPLVAERPTTNAERSLLATRHSPLATFPILIEKILSPNEHLRSDWETHGTTGYEFLNDLEALFVDAAGAERIEREYRGIVGGVAHGGFREEVLRGKREILAGALAADVRRLVRLLRTASRGVPGAPNGAGELRLAVEELAAALPVYRTYLDAAGDVHPDDRGVLERALADARAAGRASPASLDLLERIFLGDHAADGKAEEARRVFVARFQQTSGPATAKGVEDTALYRYAPLASRNEVGGEPDRPLGDAPDVLHRANAERAERWPAALVTTNTHDTKRGADVRARIDVLSEIPDDWLALVRRWRRANRKLRPHLGRRLVPDEHGEWLLYQTFVGMWPVGNGEWAMGNGHGATSEHAERRTPNDEPPFPIAHSPFPPIGQRLSEYMLKAVREAKTRTSWTAADEGYEAALGEFVRALLEDDDAAHFRRGLDALVRRVAPAAAWNTLARIGVHLGAPGTPDLYRGDELWNFTLVDPDNRRPVDFERRARLLEEIEASAFASNGADLDPADDRLKLRATSALLRARREHPEIFAGAYLPLAAHGARAGNLFAFARGEGERVAVTVVPRLTLALPTAPGAPLGAAAWGDAAIEMPASARGVRRWRDAITGREVEGDGARAAASDVLSAFPIALLLPA